MTGIENGVKIFEGMLSTMVHTHNDWRGGELGKLITYDRVCEMAFEFRALIAPMYRVTDGEFHRIVNRILDGTTLYDG